MSMTPCEANRTVQLVVAAMPIVRPDAPPGATPSGKAAGGVKFRWFEGIERNLERSANQTREMLGHLAVALPNVRVHVHRATNGFNHTQVIEHLLESRLPFHGLSAGGKRWGKLATFLTKVRALEAQLAFRWPWMLLLEDDLRIVPRYFWPFLHEACGIYNRSPQLSVLQLSRYAEAMLVSLDGAARLLERVRADGIFRSDDQQLLTKPMGAGHFREYSPSPPPPPSPSSS